MRRFDVNGDGVLTRNEVASREQKIFTFLDRDDDGRVEKSEFRRRPFFRHSEWRKMHGD